MSSWTVLPRTPPPRCPRPPAKSMVLEGHLASPFAAKGNLLVQLCMRRLPQRL